MAEPRENETENISVEAAFEALEALLARLRSEDVPLEESFTQYQKGLKLIDRLNRQIDGYEKQLAVWEASSEEK